MTRSHTPSAYTIPEKIADAYWTVVLRVPPLNRLYAAYLNWRYGPDEWEDTYAEDPLGGSWQL